MDAWGKWTKTNDKLILAADGNGEFVTATGLVQGMFFLSVCILLYNRTTNKSSSLFLLLDNPKLSQN